MESLLLQFLQVAEKSAIKAYPWIGKGDVYGADGAATAEMRALFNDIEFSGSVVIGEGEIDDAPMLYIGEQLGKGTGLEVDIAVDPIEGTNPTIKGQNNGMTVLVAAPKGSLLHAPDMYMKKIAVGPRAKGKVDLDAPFIDNLKAVAKANGKSLNQLHVAIQERERHKEYINAVYELGGRVSLFEDGDVIYSLATCLDESDIDMLVGIGGAPEGVIAAAAIKSLGGDFQAKLQPINDEETSRCHEMGINDLNKPLLIDDLITSNDCIFVATVLTDNILMNGISEKNNIMRLQSLVLNGKEGMLRKVESSYYNK